MKLKVQEKEHALDLRRQGYCYKDILAKVPVAKSTLSNWLKDLPLTDEENEFLQDRRSTNISKGRVRAGNSLHKKRLERDEEVFRNARISFNLHKDNPAFVTGIALYWAEGSKRNSGFSFINSDEEMLEVMINWIEDFLTVRRKDIRARLYTHQAFIADNNERHWSERLRIPKENFGKTIIKPSGLTVKKRPNYKGCLRIEIGSVACLRTVLCWQRLLVEEYRKER